MKSQPVPTPRIRSRLLTPGFRILTSAYASLSSTVRAQSDKLDSLQSSLENTVASTNKLLWQLRNLHQSTSHDLNSLTESSIPKLTQDSETRLAALQRAHVSNSISQLASLKIRISTAREKSASLEKRVGKCVQRAAAEEERERAELRSHKRRIGLTWSFLGLLVLLWISAAFWKVDPKSLYLDPVDFEEVSRGNAHLRNTLKSKGVEWVLDETHQQRAEASDQESKRQFGHHGRSHAGSYVPEMLSKASPTPAADDGRLEQLFGSL